MASTQAPASTYSVQIGPSGSSDTEQWDWSNLCECNWTKLTTVSLPFAKKSARNPTGKKVDGKTFTLRNIDPSKVKTCDQLKSVVRAQLQDDICTADFDVGYLQNNTVVSLRSPEDMQEIWSNIMKGTKV